MLTQTSVHSKVSPASPEPDGLNYNFTYQYNGPRPHAATRIGNWAYLYDANGNVIEQQWIGDQGEGHGNDWGGDNHGGSQSMNLAPAAPTSNTAVAANDQGGPGNTERDAHGNFRYGDHRYGGEHGGDWGMQNPHYGQGGGPKDQTFVWDEENRLIHTYGFGGPTDYLYDDNGERALKRGEHGETWYIDKYYQVQNGHQIEKHIFVGDTRVVTRLEDGDGFDSGYEEHNIFYYHPDHLGSTTFVTTQDGHEWEHMEYTPYGQQWIDEGTDKSVIAYRFTSKEYDSETGMYYYGKRYLDPVPSRWMTPDPALESFLPVAPIDKQARQHNQNLPGAGGVFNFLNLNPYAYAGNNPVKYTDPTGMAPQDQPKNPPDDNVQINPPGRDPTKSPGEGWEWRGAPGSKPGDENGGWFNPGTGQSLHPDLNHPGPIGPHWDYTPGKGKPSIRIDPDTGRPLNLSSSQMQLPSLLTGNGTPWGTQPGQPVQPPKLSQTLPLWLLIIVVVALAPAGA